jgi:hypothetical protein
MAAASASRAPGLLAGAAGMPGAGASNGAGAGGSVDAESAGASAAAERPALSAAGYAVAMRPLAGEIAGTFCAALPGARGRAAGVMSA